MEIDLIRHIFGWCAIINLGILLWWFLFLSFAHDWTYRVHNKWFQLSVQQFDTIHYVGMLLFKLAIFFFNLVPYFALQIVG
jgi:prepilin signal peptidase PulO-like enzyme (type II secretory pathway)